MIEAEANNGSRSLVWPSVLWLMVWGSYNTGIERLLDSSFPANALDLFHGLRALLPFGAGFLAVIILLMRRSIPGWPFTGPGGLLALYAVVGMLSSLLLAGEFLSNAFWIAVYWAGQYLCVLVVLWAILASPDPLPRLTRVINLNWIIIALLLGGVFLAIAVMPGLVFAPRSYLFVHTDGGDFGKIIFGMPTTRSTGIGRYAALLGLVALARFGGSLWSKALWLTVLLLSLQALIVSQARASIAAFLVGAFVIVWLRSRPKEIVFTAVLLAVALLHVAGFADPFWDFITRERPLDFILSGRTLTWGQGLELFSNSPLIGYGFHADRLFLAGQHMHNAFLHALVQTGILGTLPFIAAYLVLGLSLLRIYGHWRYQSVIPLPAEIPAVLILLIMISVTESTLAFFGSVWLIAAPFIAYIQLVVSANRWNSLSTVRNSAAPTKQGEQSAVQQTP